MRRRIFKITIILIVCLTQVLFHSLAAVVSDNDGSAFITKAEFDSLKNNFQSVINKYQTSIDSKIDEAIASYLSGIVVSSEITLENYINKYLNNQGVTRITPKNNWSNNGGQFSYYTNVYIGIWWAWTCAAGGTGTTVSGEMNFTNGTPFYPSWYDQWGNVSSTATAGDDNRYMGVASSKGIKYVDFAISDVYTSATSLNTGVYTPAYGGSLYSLAITNNGTQFDNRKTTSAYNVSYTMNAIAGNGNYDKRSDGSDRRGEGGSMNTNNGLFYYTANKKNVVMTQPVKVSGNLNMISKENYDVRKTNKTELSTNMRYCSVNQKDSHSMNIQRNWYLTPVREAHAKDTLYIDFFNANYNLNVKLYEGLPLTKCEKTGVLNFTINFSGNPQGNFCIRNKPFTNTDSAEPQCAFKVDKGTENEIETTNYNPTAGDHTITLNVKNNEIYYLKYIPNTEGASYAITSDLVEKVTSKE